MANILIVDDQPDIRRVMARIVRHAGHDPVAAAGGDAALEYLAATVPDLILLDVMMPDVDGFEVLPPSAGTRGRRVCRWSCSARSARPISSTGAGGGATDYWVKGSVSAEAIVAGLAAHLGADPGSLPRRLEFTHPNRRSWRKIRRIRFPKMPCAGRVCCCHCRCHRR